jgi:hypothetical protein
MTVLLDELVTERPAILFANAGHNAVITAARGKAQSLDEVLGGVWEDLAGGRAAMCLVCGGSVTPRVGQAAGGDCRDCGSGLS